MPPLLLGLHRARQRPDLTEVRGRMDLLPTALAKSVFIVVWAQLRKGTGSFFKSPIETAAVEPFPVMPVTHLPLWC